MTQQAGVQSVRRALTILSAFDNRSSELGVGELAGRLDVHPSTASRLAATLVAQGFLEREEEAGPFRLGPELIRLGLLAAGASSLIATARPAMEELAAELAETIVLSVASGTSAVDIAQVDARYLIGGKSWIGRQLPLHATSDGKVLLAWGAAARPAGQLGSVTKRTITSRDELDAELVRIRNRGFATAVGELEEGLNGVAAPIFSRDGTCVAALNVSGPSYRLPSSKLQAVGRRCRQAAVVVSGGLGWSGGWSGRLDSGGAAA